MARLFRGHKRTYAEIDVMGFCKMSANKKAGGGIMLNCFTAWNPATGKAEQYPDHFLHMSEKEACELIAALAETLKP